MMIGKAVRGGTRTREDCFEVRVYIHIISFENNSSYKTRKSTMILYFLLYTKTLKLLTDYKTPTTTTT